MTVRHTGILLGMLVLTACGAPDQPPPPPPLMFDGLPVSGSPAAAQQAGFTNCIEMRRKLRCRRGGVMILGQGPFSAAVELAGSDGRGGFNELTLWHDSNQYALYKVRDALRENGWNSCLIGEGRKGDRMILTRPGATVRITMEISYWSKRNLQVIPESSPHKPTCSTASPAID